MSDDRHRCLPETVELRIAEEIDSICSEFDAALRHGRHDRIEDYLLRRSVASALPLLRELLPIELEYRRKRGELPTSDEYEQRLPDFAVQIREFFAAEETAKRSVGETPTRDYGEHAARPGAPEEPVSGQTFGDYELLEQIASGGMGVVFRARQRKLNRIVALKMIRSGQFASDEEIKRFNAEAEAAARLDHHHIVPIYEIGESHGRHYFSMALIDGVSLQERLNEGPLPAKPAARLLEKIARAVHFAHENGVVHRDLKPSNILLQSESQQPKAESDEQSTDANDRIHHSLLPTLNPKITDFGLAKRIDIEPEMTRTGDVMGTPGYMPPEQAVGNVQLIGPKSDVYSLGAILYALVTGRPPFQLANVIETLQQVLEKEPIPPRQLNPRVDRDLETICLKCLEKNPSHRYESAAAVADDLQRYREKRPIVARPIGPFSRTWRWCTRNRLATIAIALLLILIFGGGTATWLYQRDKIADRAAATVRSQQAKKDIASALERSSSLRDQSQFDAAATLIAQAERRLAEIPESSELHAVVRQANADLTVVRRLDEIRSKKARMASQFFVNEFAIGRDGAYAKTFRSYGIDLFGTESQQELAMKIASSDVKMSLVTSLDEWAEDDGEHTKKILKLAQAADRHPFRSQLRHAILQRDRSQLLELAKRVDLASQRPATLQNLSHQLMMAGEDDAAINLLVRSAIQHPNDFWLQFDAGERLSDGRSPRSLEAIGYYKAALAIRPHNAAVNHNLGYLLMNQDGRSREAETAIRRALQTEPEYALALTNLANLLSRTDRKKEAEAAFRRAIRAKPKVPFVHFNFGSFLDRSGRLKEAIVQYRKSAVADAGNGLAHYKLGFALHRVGQLEEAEPEYRRAIRSNPQHAFSHYHLAILLQQTNRKQEAEAAFRRALKVNPQLSSAHNDFAVFLKQNGRLKEAETEYRFAIQFDPKNVNAHHNLGILLETLGRWKEAEAAYRKAIEVDPKFAKAHYALGMLLVNHTDRFSDALNSLQRGHALGSARKYWRYPSEKGMATAKRLIHLDKKLQAIKNGSPNSMPASDALELAEFALYRKSLPQLALDLFQRGLRDPSLKPDILIQQRYNAACAALRCAADVDRKGAIPAEAGQSTNLRNQAREWLQANLTFWKGKIQSNARIHAAVRKRMRHWQNDNDLLAVRGDAIDSLPRQERLAWRQLWHDVAEIDIGVPAVAPKPR